MSLSRLLIFVAVLGALSALVHYYLWTRLVRDPEWPQPWRNVGTVVIVILGVLIALGGLAIRAPREWSRIVLWPTYTWLGALSFLFFTFVAFDAAQLVIRTLRGSSTDVNVENVDVARRHVLARWLAGAAGLLAIGVTGAGMSSALAEVEVKKVKVALGLLPEGARGYRIVQITDIHVGPTIGREFLSDIVARVNALKPDLVAITGDLVDGSVADLKAHVAPLADLRAKDGVFFVTGNHEYYSGANDWIAHVSSLGIRVLRNERVPIAAGFDLAGIDDVTGHGFGAGHGADLERAMEGRDESRAVVLLSHQPKSIKAAAAHKVDLQISGHTHGGQFFPFTEFVKLDQPYVAGLHRHDATTQIYVSRGTGYWGPPIRVGAPAEITEIELVPA